jgi:hypothetical protein
MLCKVLLKIVILHFSIFSFFERLGSFKNMLQFIFFSFSLSMFLQSFLLLWLPSAKSLRLSFLFPDVQQIHWTTMLSRNLIRLYYKINQLLHSITTDKFKAESRPKTLHNIGLDKVWVNFFTTPKVFTAKWIASPEISCSLTLYPANVYKMVGSCQC